MVSNFICNLSMMYKKGDLFPEFYSVHCTGLHMLKTKSKELVWSLVGWPSLPTLVFCAFCSAEGLKWPTAAGWTHPSCFAWFEIWSDALRQPVITAVEIFSLPIINILVLIPRLNSKGEGTAFLSYNKREYMDFFYYLVGIASLKRNYCQRVWTFLTLNMYCQVSSWKGCTNFYPHKHWVVFIKNIILMD